MASGTIYEAAYNGDFDLVKDKVEENRCLVEIADESKRLLIHWASLSGNLNLVEYLLDSGSPIDPVDDTNFTPLILASSAGKLEVVRLLISKCANVNHQTDRGQTSLHYACSKGHKQVCTKKGYLKIQPLRGVKSGCKVCMKQHTLLGKISGQLIDTFCPGTHMETLKLMQIVELLIKAGADVNAVDEYKATPLHRVASLGLVKIAELLLQHPDIYLDIQNSTGCTPLHLACEEERDHLAYMLVKAGARRNITNRDHKTPLDLSSTKLKTTLTNIVV